MKMCHGVNLVDCRASPNLILPGDDDDEWFMIPALARTLLSELGRYHEPSSSSSPNKTRLALFRAKQL
jgi:hypothetical protein